MAAYDAIVIGAGHNGLVTAAYLAKAGQRVLVAERRERVGGLLDTVEVAPGVKAPGVFHTVGRLRRSIVRDLDLVRHGLVLIDPPVRVFAPQPDGSAVTLFVDPGRTAAGLRERSPKDAEAFLPFDRKVRALASFLAHLNAATPPDLKSPGLADAVSGLRLGKAYRDLGQHAARETARALPMAIADYVGEVFETEPVRAAIAARAVQYTAMGPWSAHTTTTFLNDSAGNDGGAAGQTTFARGGPGALADALASAARSAGAEVRTSAEVTRIIVSGGRAVGVVLDDDEEVSARAIVTANDPKATFQRLLDPVVVGPHLLWRAGNIRTPGTVSKVNLVLSDVPAFVGTDGVDRLSGRIVIAPSIDYIEHAFDASKYGRISEEPYLEATIPTLSDPSLAPEGQHVVSVVAQWTSRNLREGDWDPERDGLGELVVKTLERYAPGLSGLITATQVMTPKDIEQEYGVSGGHPYHAEPGLDQWFAWRPMVGFARYRLGLPGLYLAGSGAHPGGGVTGAPGANAAREILADLKK